MNAFVSSSLARPVLRESSFTSTDESSCFVTRPVSLGPSMLGLDSMLSKYNKMSMSSSKPAPGPSKPSNVWTAYTNSVKDKFFNVFEQGRKTIKPLSGPTTAPYYRIQYVLGLRPLGSGNPDDMCNPFTSADRYIAKCCNMQYKMTAVPNGVYSVRCTEGTVKHQAEESRSAALSAEFRLKQRSRVQKFADYTETRRKAIIASYGCSYEEKLVDRFPVAARAVVRGASEAMGVCVRYAEGVTKEEKYMAGCVDKQSKFRSVPYGVYDVLCSDGNAKNVAEFKRVSAISAQFRAGQISAIAKEQLKYDTAKYARDYYSHGCTYEEKLYNKYPAVAASMRPDAARY